VTLEWVHKKRDGTEVPTGVFINSMTLEGQPVSLPPSLLFSFAIRAKEDSTLPLRQLRSPRKVPVKQRIRCVDLVLRAAHGVFHSVVIWSHSDGWKCGCKGVFMSLGERHKPWIQKSKPLLVTLRLFQTKKLFLGFWGCIWEGSPRPFVPEQGDPDHPLLILRRFGCWS
jgi:hypothetical protein